MRQRQRVVRFTVVGGANALVDVAVFNLLLFVIASRDPVALMAYNTVAVVAALLNSYLWNSRWTFRDRRASRRARTRQSSALRRQRWLFLAQAGVNLAVMNAAIYVLSTLLPPLLGLPGVLVSNIVKVSATVLASAVSYVLMHRLVFTHRPTTAEQGPRDEAALRAPAGQ